MNKEEIEELKDFTIDITDIDELALGLEVCSKKTNMVIQEFANLIIELQQQNKKYKEVIDKAIEMIKDYIPEEYVRSYDTKDGVGRYELDTDSWQYRVYEMLKEVK